MNCFIFRIFSSLFITVLGYEALRDFAVVTCPPLTKFKDNKNCQKTTKTRMLYDPMLHTVRHATKLVNLVSTSHEKLKKIIFRSGLLIAGTAKLGWITNFLANPKRFANVFVIALVVIQNLQKPIWLMKVLQYI